MNQPRFSVIVPTFNRRDLLVEALDSIQQQTFSSFEVIVVDDGSTDGTKDYLASCGERVRVLTQSNRGPGAARNAGVEAAGGSYLAFLDSDDLWFPWTLATYASLIDAHGSPAFIAGRPFRFDDPKALSDAKADKAEANRFDDYLRSGDEWRWWGVSSFVIQKDVLRGVGGFSVENINGEDADLALRLGDARGFVQVAAPFTFGYREHAVNVRKELTKTLAGARYLIQQERNGSYPGGDLRSAERWRILTRHVRPVSLECLQVRRIKDGWELYRSTLSWHIRLGRWKYIAAFPLLALVGLVRK